MKPQCNQHKQQTAEATQRAAALAPTLTDTALRTLLGLTLQADERGKILTTLKELCSLTGCSDRATRSAIQALARDGHITVRRGRQHQATIYTLRPATDAALDLRPATNAALEPLRPATDAALDLRPATNAALEPLRPATDAALDLRPATNAALEAEAPIRNARAHAPIDIEGSIEEKIDRLLNARPNGYAEAQHAEMSLMIQSHQAAYATRIPNRPPDKYITAQLLAINAMSEIGITAMLADLRTERRTAPGNSWTWYIAVAAQRCCGITPQELAAARATRKQARKPGAAAAESASRPNPQFRDDLLAGMLATSKAMPAAGGHRRR